MLLVQALLVCAQLRFLAWTFQEKKTTVVENWKSSSWVLNVVLSKDSAVHYDFVFLSDLNNRCYWFGDEKLFWSTISYVPIVWKFSALSAYWNGEAKLISCSTQLSFPDYLRRSRKIFFFSFPHVCWLPSYYPFSPPRAVRSDWMSVIQFLTVNWSIVLWNKTKNEID